MWHGSQYPTAWTRYRPRLQVAFWSGSASIRPPWNASARPSQKAIIIGKGGEMLKRIGTLTRKEIQEMLGCRVHLELFVKVERDWTRTASGLRRVGFGDPR